MARAYFSSWRHLANVDVMSVDYRIDPPLDDPALNDLFARAWSDHVPRQFSRVLAHSLGVVCAFDSATLVGFVNLATDGSEHALSLIQSPSPRD
jgi:hypothetical protein